MVAFQEVVGKIELLEVMVAEKFVMVAENLVMLTKKLVMLKKKLVMVAENLVMEAQLLAINGSAVRGVTKSFFLRRA